ncbi:MAG: DUF4873 domain-containing protein [Nocardiaceae bacterium]|nr:DUF4873 domain-containing protein [Nocardiaceae bacterium]
MNDPDYRGPAVLSVDGDDFPVMAVLAGHLDPIDGKFHWFGRISGPKLPNPGRMSAHVTIGPESRAVRLEERDPWGNLRVSGVGSPPYGMGELTSR